MSSHDEETEAAALAKAEKLASDEGIQLIRGCGKSGFFKVEQSSYTPYTYTVRSEDRRTSLGSFSTAAEAALCYARHTAVQVAGEVQVVRVEATSDSEPEEDEVVAVETLPPTGRRPTAQRSRSSAHSPLRKRQAL